MTSLYDLKSMNPRHFEEYVAKLLAELHYSKVELSSYTADSGYDISAYKDGKLILFECKRYSDTNKVGSRDVRIFADACRRMKAKKGIFITTSSFTRTVYQEQRERGIEIEFWDGKELIRRIKSKKPVPAYCIICNKNIKGKMYEEFDWKDEVIGRHTYHLSVSESPFQFKKSDLPDLMPKNPIVCRKCQFFTKCEICKKEIDVRKPSAMYLKRESGDKIKEAWYCVGCGIPLKKKRNRRNNFNCIILLSILIGSILFFIFPNQIFEIFSGFIEFWTTILGFNFSFVFIIICACIVLIFMAWKN